MLDLKFAPLVTIVQHYISTKLEVPTVFPCLRENRRHRTDGQTDGLQRLMRSSIMEGRKIKNSVDALTAGALYHIRMTGHGTSLSVYTAEGFAWFITQNSIDKAHVTDRLQSSV